MKSTFCEAMAGYILMVLVVAVVSIITTLSIKHSSDKKEAEYTAELKWMQTKHANEIKLLKASAKGTVKGYLVVYTKVEEVDMTPIISYGEVQYVYKEQIGPNSTRTYNIGDNCLWKTKKEAAFDAYTYAEQVKQRLKKDVNRNLEKLKELGQDIEAAKRMIKGE